MEDAIRVKNEIEAAYTDVKCEKSLPKDDENECTPLRDEGGPSPDQAAVTETSAAGWGSDDEDQMAMPPAPSPPSLDQEMSIKLSPTNEYDQTPLRVSATDRAQPTEPQRESQTNGSFPDVPDNYFDDLLTDPLEPRLPHDVTVKKEERRELQLGFLDVLSETDFEGVTGAYSQVNQLNDMDLEPPPMPQQPSIPVSEEERELQLRIEERRRELEHLERSTAEKKRKKHKKEKKHESHKKRRRSHSGSPQKSRKERRTVEPGRSNGSRHSTAPVIKTEPEQLDFVPVHADEKSVKVVNINKLMQPAAAADAGPPPTTREKRRLAVERAKSVLNLMRLKASKAPETVFLVVDTIRKLPSRASYMNSDLFMNPSPLCNNFNVTYKFNSTSASNINLSKWGLERLPETTAALLRLTGIDVARLMELKENPKMALHKLRSTQQAENGAEDECLSTGLYKSVSTQTDARLSNRSRDVGVQAMPAAPRGVYWLDPRFDQADLTQQHTNVLLALKELCATNPSSSSWADKLFRELRHALAIKRAEVKEVGH
ncbi:protein panoramix [Drosophila novamexicana]|uniref:protein panoramix n=1 Tax=Drosophila novamexicana TaxID=47314 RepID=UPI0011E5AB78|nr:protein panoramix [Drosophila novamexicana]